MMTMHPFRRNGFTIVEILVVISIIGVLLAILIPTLSTIRESAGETTCGSNLRELSSATQAYLTTWENHLPQVAVSVPGDPSSPSGASEQIIGALFAGKRGELPYLGINEYGINDRPLNKYLIKTAVADNDSAEMIDEYFPVCECPLDRGQKAHPHTHQEYVEQMHQYLGCSYTLNDHTLDGDEFCTLVPRRSGGKAGGRMPGVADPSKTWLLGDHPIYNYQEGGDRRQWWHFKQVRVNLAFVDGHVGLGIDIPEGIQNTTRQYTFLPNPDWDCRD